MNSSALKRMLYIINKMVLSQNKVELDALLLSFKKELPALEHDIRKMYRAKKWIIPK